MWLELRTPWWQTSANTTTKFQWFVTAGIITGFVFRMEFARRISSDWDLKESRRQAAPLGSIERIDATQNQVKRAAHEVRVLSDVCLTEDPNEGRGMCTMLAECGEW